MKTKIEIAWKEISEGLTERQIAKDAYILRRLDPASRFDIYAGMDASDCVMLAIGVRRPPPSINLASAALDYFRQQRADGTWLMALRLRQSALAGVFGRLCQDLVDALISVADETELVALVRDRLSLWKKLFEHGQSGLLEPFQVKGLMAELLILESIIINGTRTPLEAVNAWVGPLEADQDFQFSDEAIEVKAIGPNADGVSISSLQQLDSPLPLRLTVQTMRSASPGEEGAIDLNSLVLRIETGIAAFPDALAIFKARMLEGRYVENPYYDTIPFQLVKSEAFIISRNFPKLTLSMVPDGVMSATYELSLNAIRDSD